MDISTFKYGSKCNECKAECANEYAKVWIIAQMNVRRKRHVIVDMNETGKSKSHAGENDKLWNKIFDPFCSTGLQVFRDLRLVSHSSAPSIKPCLCESYTDNYPAHRSRGGSWRTTRFQEKGRFLENGGFLELGRFLHGVRTVIELCMDGSWS